MSRSFAAVLIVWLASAAAVAAAPTDRQDLVRGLCGGAVEAGETATRMLSAVVDASVDERSLSARLLDAVMTRRLICPEEAADPVAIKEQTSTVDALTGAPLDPAPAGRAPVVSLKNRATFETLSAALTLLGSASVEDRGRALDTLAKSPQLLPAGFFERAAKGETDRGLADRIATVEVVAALGSPDIPKRIAAIERLTHAANRRVLSQIQALKMDPAYAATPAFARAVDTAIAGIGRALLIGDVLSALYNGLSFASILFMASIGLAIIFGLMGVINLAQGEFIMLGAYVTYAVQEALRALLPALIDWYLVIAIPFAFAVTALIGIALEATLIRHLYRRPLMSLLATWAVSLALTNLVRVTVGTQNLQMETPFYITGGIPVIGDFIMTWNRLFAIAFAIVTLAGSWLLIRRTGFGLDVRAVTQNRDMASCIGIPTRRIDMIAFGLGSGLAGLAGLVLSPIYNVNPQMGTNFIVDSFMVVVLGGVGSIVGTVIAALGIGQINVLIEPLWGAVAAKVIVLALIIAFLQWRPEGLFAVAGRRK